MVAGRLGSVLHRPLSLVQIAGDLQVHPELRRGLQYARKENSSLCTHVPLTINECIDPLDWDTHLSGELNLAHPQWLQELLEQDFAWMRRLSVFRNHFGFPLVVICYLNILHVTVSPLEYNSVLVIDSNRVIARPFALQCFQSIRWRHSKITELRGSVKHIEFPHSH